MAEIAYPLGYSGSDDSLRLVPEVQEDEYDRIPIPTNDFDIVIPPPFEACLGENCRFRGDQAVCGLNRHHLCSTEPLFEAHSQEAADFRKLIHLTAWMHYCRHYEHHDKHELEVPVPRLEVIRHCTAETRKLRALDMNHNSLSGLNAALYRPEISEREKLAKLRAIEKLLAQREDLVRAVDTIEIIPEELVTGALLLSAPNCARVRVYNGSGFILTGNIPKEQTPAALAFGNEAVVTKVAEDLGVAMLHFNETESNLGIDGDAASDGDIEVYLEDRRYFHDRRRELLERLGGLQIINPQAITALSEMSPEQIDVSYAAFGLTDSVVRRVQRRWENENRRKHRRGQLAA